MFPPWKTWLGIGSYSERIGSLFFLTIRSLLLMSCWYTRRELPMRMAFFYYLWASVLPNTVTAKKGLITLSSPVRSSYRPFGGLSAMNSVDYMLGGAPDRWMAGVGFQWVFSFPKSCMSIYTVFQIVPGVFTVATSIVVFSSTSLLLSSFWFYWYSSINQRCSYHWFVSRSRIYTP